MQKPSNYVPKGLLRKNAGDILTPVSGGFRYIITLGSTEGHYDNILSSLVSKRWPSVAGNYKQIWREMYGKIKPGNIQITQVQSDTSIIILTAIVDDKIDLKALNNALNKAGIQISENKGSAHILKLSFEPWDKILPLVEEQLLKRSINVTLYDKEG